jgi:hypothetical protein
MRQALVPLQRAQIRSPAQALSNAVLQLRQVRSRRFRVRVADSSPSTFALRMIPRVISLVSLGVRRQRAHGTRQPELRCDIHHRDGRHVMPTQGQRAAVHQVPQDGACARDPALHGTDRAATHRRHICIFEARCADEQQRLPLFRRQVRKGATKIAGPSKRPHRHRLDCIRTSAAIAIRTSSPIGTTIGGVKCFIMVASPFPE